MHEIRLMKDGLHVEIGYLNWFGRRKKKFYYTMPIIDLTPPPMHSDSSELKGDLFPNRLEIFDIKDHDKDGVWVKYYEEVRRRMFIPKTYDYMDRELMVSIMQGKFIDTTNN